MSLLLAIQARLASDYAGVFNLVPDPSFEAADLSQWSVLNGATLAQSTSNATSRTNSLRVQGTTFNQGAQITVPTVPGQTYRVRADVFIATGGAGVEAALGFDGTNFSTSPGATGAFTLTVQIAATGTSTSLVLASSGSGGTFDFYFDAVAVVPTTDSVPYFDGGTTGDWLGTPDHSASRLSDVAARAVRNLGRTAPDALATHDAAARGVQLPRTAPDSLGTSDAATRVSTQARAAGDYASVLNLIPNPSFEGADLSQWTITDPRTLTPTQSTLHATSRTNSMRIQGTGNAGVVTTVPVIPGQRYYLRASIYVAAIDPGGGSTVGVSAASGVNRAVNPGDQVTIAVPTAPAAGSTQTVSVSASSSGFSVPVDFYVDSVALIPITGTDASYPYFDGGTTGDWTGTPEYSASRLSDVATRVQSLPRTAPDSLGTHDAVARTVFRGLTASDSLGTSDAAARGTALPRTTADRLATRDDDRNLFVYQSYEGGLLPSPLGGGLAVPNFGSTATLAVTDSTDSISGSKSLELTVTPQPGTSGVIIDLNHFGPNNSSLTPGDTRNIRVVPGQQSAGTGMVKIVSTTGGNVTQAGFGTSRYHADGSQSGSGSTDFAPTVGVWTSRVIQPPGLSATEVFVSPALHLAFDSTTTQIVLRLDQLLWREDGGVGGVSYFDGDTPGAVWEGGAGLGPSRIGHAVRAIQSFPRIAADSLGTHDAATQTRIFPRTASDSLGTSDAAVRAVAPTRVGSDLLYTTDGYFNLVQNPSFESDVTGAVARAGSSDTLPATRTTAQSYVGTASAQFTQTGSATTNIVAAIGNYGADIDHADTSRLPSIGGITKARAAVRIESLTGGTLTGISVGCRFYRADGTFAGGSASGLGVSPVLGTWYEGGPGSPGVPSDALYAAVSVIISGTGLTGVVFQVDAVQLLANATVQRPYVDGNQPNGYWRGAANDSVSEFSVATRGAQSFARTTSDSLGTTDSATRSLQLPRTTSDSLGTSDSAVGSIVGSSPNRTTADSLGTSDAATRLVTLPRAAADALATSDAATRTSARPRTTGDALGTSDAATRQSQTFPRTSADTLGTTDAATRLLTTTRTAADTLGTSDAATRSFTRIRTTTDTLGTSDVATRLTAYTRTSVDTLGTNDSATRHIVLVRSASDALGTTDAATRTQAFARTGSDTLGTSDAAAKIVIRPRTSADTLGTSDAATRPAILRIRTASDTLGTSDAAVTQSAHNLVRASADSLGTHDAATRAALAFSRSGSDTLGTSDASTRIVVQIRSSADALVFTDAAARVRISARTTADSLGTSDAAARSFIRSRTGSDTLGTSDAATRVRFSVRTASDSLGTSDVASPGLRVRTATDTLGTSDSAIATRGHARTSTDTLGTTDAVATRRALFRLASDTLGTSDAVSRQQTLVTAAADSLATTDAATRAYLAIKFGSDVTTVSDAAERGIALSGRLALDALLTSDDATRGTLWARLAFDSLLTNDFVRAAPAPLTYISSGHASPLYAAGGKGEQADARGYVTPTIEP